MTNTDGFIALFQDMQTQVYDNSAAHGFHSDDELDYAVPTRLALIHSEVSEALEAHRKGEDGHIAEELADVVIRTMDLAESLSIDLGTAIAAKHLANLTRPFKHGNKKY